MNEHWQLKITRSEHLRDVRQVGSYFSKSSLIGSIVCAHFDDPAVR
jgi:hypothetical protein